MSHEIPQIHEKPPIIEQGQTLKLPDNINIINALQNKLAEYKARLRAAMQADPYKAPELFVDTNYKIAVLERLLTTGEVSKAALAQELHKRDNFLDEQVFNNAFLVIEDYAKTGGRGVTGGTGLRVENKQVE